ncbi:MAG: ACP S-malonyltransferase [Planctomycetes bacterium]|nr:ACP S-malonyltransferase [Planctomycetota bacterium]
MGKTAFLFPGQGAQVVGMGKDLAEAYPEARALYDQADAILGFGLSQVCFEGPEDRLTATDISQPAILVTSLAALAAMRTTEAGRALEPEAAAGLSLGEYTALVAAGAIAFEDAVRLTHLRGRFMQEACDAQASGMVSLLGVDVEGAEKICEAARTAGIIWPANYNCPGQVVVSGVEAACARAVELAESYGAQRAVPLQVAGGFHSPLMAPAREQLAPHLLALRVGELRFPVVANVTGDYYSDPAPVADLLARQVDGPVLWQQGIERLLADGFDRFVEIGPGRVLTGLLKRIDRQVGRAAVAVGTVEDIETLVGESA